ncbi:MAG: SGNH/GDSL hydrolase family protein [Clostridia bacterium]|nr:SGNH/GDSL hydrolase family protein [Clostridia bacterium]
MMDNRVSESPYAGKAFSILGDSISTLEGYNPDGYNLYYYGTNSWIVRVLKPLDTWWGKVIDRLGGRLLVNDSWSGSRVTRIPYYDEQFPSGCCDERTGGLHVGDALPDVIIVYLGTNDWGFGARPDMTREEYYDGDEDIASGITDTVFSEAYAMMLGKLRRNYPEAEIWCCTLGTTFIPGRPDFVFPPVCEGVHVETFNDIIRQAVEDEGGNVRLIDFYGFHTPYSSVDGTHPDADGMESLADMAVRSMLGG